MVPQPVTCMTVVTHKTGLKHMNESWKQRRAGTGTVHHHWHGKVASDIRRCPPPPDRSNLDGLLQLQGW